MNALVDQTINGLASGAVYALIASGLSLLFRVLDTVNFAHGEFYVLGGVAGYLVSSTLGVTPWLSLVLAVLVPALLAVLVHSLLRGVLEKSPLNVLLATFAISLAISNLVSHSFRGVAQAVPPFVSGSLSVGPVVLTYQRLIAAIFSAVVMAAILFWLRRSRTGRSLRAVADNREGARIIGIDTVRVDRIVFVLSASTAGLAGALLAPVTQVSPYAGLPTMVTAFVVVVIGGVGSVRGALVGGLVLGVVEGLTVAVLGVQWSPMVGYVLLLLVLLLRPTLDAWFNQRRVVTA